MSKRAFDKKKSVSLPRKRSFSFGDPGNLYKGKGGKTGETVTDRVARREWSVKSSRRGIREEREEYTQVARTDKTVRSSSYSLLLAGPRNLLRGYTHRWAPVSTRKEILELLSIANIRRDTKPSSHAAFTNGCSRFSGSNDKGKGISRYHVECVLPMFSCDIETRRLLVFRKEFCSRNHVKGCE